MWSSHDLSICDYGLHNPLPQKVLETRDETREDVITWWCHDDHNLWHHCDIILTSVTATRHHHVASLLDERWSDHGGNAKLGGCLQSCETMLSAENFQKVVERVHTLMENKKEDGFNIRVVSSECIRDPESFSWNLSTQSVCELVWTERRTNILQITPRQLNVPLFRAARWRKNRYSPFSSWWPPSTK